MPLNSTEIAQCSFCEEYNRLADLQNITIGENGKIECFLIEDEDDPRYDRSFLSTSKYVGNCPSCSEPIYTRDIG